MRHAARTVLVLAAVLAAIARGGLGRPRLAAAQARPTTRVNTPAGASPASSAAARSAPGGAPTPSLTSAARSSPVPAASEADHRAVISYLGQVINWARHLEVEDSLVMEPAETLFAADDRQMAGEVLKLAFEYARAEATLLRTKAEHAPRGASVSAAPGEVGEPAPTGGLAGPSPLRGLDALVARRNAAQAEVQRANARIKALGTRLIRATRRNRDRINTELMAAQAELDLAQSRVDSINAMVDFETGTSTIQNAATGLDAQIDELERSVPQSNGQPTPQSAAQVAALKSAPPMPSGILERATNLVAIRRKEQTLDDTIGLTDALVKVVASLRTPLVDSLREIDQRGLAMTARAGSGNLAAVQQSKADFEGLAQAHQLVTNALLPLSKQMVILNLYSANLARWDATVHQQFNAELKTLFLSILGLAVLLLAVGSGALVWRKLTFRYVEDLQSRQQLLQLRRFVVIAIVGLVLLFDFANEVGTIATVMGFAAAGIALALQNVILSMAGYFYISGRFGIRAGDRVQISGISGDVLQIGFFKMTLMELNSDEYGHQPTGRAVIFPNSVVFQPNGNFFRQLPGSNFTWNELRLTLAPECDYRLAEKRLVEVVNDVVARYRDSMQREYRDIERELNLRIETPRPQSRLQLGGNGIEMVIRYPAQLHNAAQTADEIARRLLDAIKREPGLKLVAPGIPAIQPAPDAESPDSRGD
jgi:small-conductance mechanosensitive channel